MVRLPTISSGLIIKYVKYLGFEQIRQKGSHKFFKHIDGRTTTIPVHKGEDIGRGITNKIFKDIKTTKDDFINWYNNC